VARQVDPRDDRAVYKQLVDILRDQILTGDLAPGSRLPSEQHLGQAHHIGRDSVRDALAILRSEGLIVTVSGVGSRVRAAAPRTVVTLAGEDEATTRMPTPAERRRLKLAEGIPVLVVSRGDREELHAGNLTVIKTEQARTPPGED
jgi:GntR family transcriptional regulator